MQRVRRERFKKRVSQFLVTVGLALLLLSAVLFKEQPTDTRQSDPDISTILPVLERRCSASCHGILETEFSNRKHHPLFSDAFFFALNSQTSRISTAPPHLEDLKSRLFHLLDPHSPLDSPLLTYPLGETLGGRSHPSAEVFLTTTDSDYLLLKAWIQKQEMKSSGNGRINHSREVFAREVLPVLVRKGCFLSSCHGHSVFNDLKLKSPSGPSFYFSRHQVNHNYDAARGQVTRFIHLDGDIDNSRLLKKILPLDKGGVPHKGGNLQFVLGEGDPDIQRLKRWLMIEQEQAKRVAEVLETGNIHGLLFLRQPQGIFHRFLDVMPYVGGSRLMWLRFENDAPLEGSLRELNQILKISPKAQIQAMDVSYSARKVILNLRHSEEEGFGLYQFDLDSRYHPVPNSLREVLSSSPGVQYLDPVFGLDDSEVLFSANLAHRRTRISRTHIPVKAEILPDGWLRLAYYQSSNQLSGKKITLLGNTEPLGEESVLEQRSGPFGTEIRLSSGQWSSSWMPPHNVLLPLSEFVVTDAFEIYRIPLSNPVPERMTYSGATDRYPTMRTSGETMFTSLRNHGAQNSIPVFNGAIYRVHPGGFDYHIHGGNRSRISLYTQSRELPQGFEIRLGLDAENLTGAGALFLVDHGFGVNIEPGNPHDTTVDSSFSQTHLSSRSQQRFFHSVIPIFPETGEAAVRSGGLSPGGGFKDPMPLPDGRIITSMVQGVLDHERTDDSKNFDLALIELKSHLCKEHCTSAALESIEMISEANSHNYDEVMPRIISVRLPHHQTQEHKVSAFASEPYASTTFSEVHCYDYPLLESFLTDFSPNQARKFRETSQFSPDGSGVPLDKQVRFVRIVLQKQTDSYPPVLQFMKEVPLQADGSFAISLPPKTPFLFQGLNYKKQAVHQMSRFTFTQPAEKLTFSIPRSVFSLRCAGCHGPLNGKKDSTILPPDLTTAASLVLANWDADAFQPKRPLGIDTYPLQEVYFVPHVSEILEKRCLSCHDEKGQMPYLGRANGFRLAYQNLLQAETGNKLKGKYIDFHQALSSNSPIFQSLNHKDKCNQKENLTEADLLILSRFIDLGVPFSAREQKL